MSFIVAASLTISGRNWLATSRHCARALAASPRAKTVSMKAATLAMRPASLVARPGGDLMYRDPFATDDPEGGT